MISILCYFLVSKFDIKFFAFSSFFSFLPFAIRQNWVLVSNGSCENLDSTKKIQRYGKCFTDKFLWPNFNSNKFYCQNIWPKKFERQNLSRIKIWEVYLLVCTKALKKLDCSYYILYSSIEKYFAGSESYLKKFNFNAIIKI